MRPDNNEELANYLHALGELLAAGVPLLESLELQKPGRTGSALVLATDVADRVVSGATLAMAVRSAVPKCPDTALALLAAAEASGSPAQGLLDAATQLAVSRQQRREIQSALAYPAILLVGGCLVLLLLGVVVLPVLVLQLAEAGAPIPFSARALVAAPPILATGAAIASLLCAGVLAARRDPDLRIALDDQLFRLLHRLPLIRGVVGSLTALRWLRALSGLLDSGMPLPDALAIVVGQSRYLPVQRRVETCRLEVLAGNTLSASLHALEMLPHADVALISAGERAGRLAPMIRFVTERHARHARASLQSLTRVLEPTLVALIGGIVSAIALALLQSSSAVRETIR